MELSYNFFKTFCHAYKYEKLEMDTNSLHLGLSAETLEDVILSVKRDQCNAMQSRD